RRLSRRQRFLRRRFDAADRRQQALPEPGRRGRRGDRRARQGYGQAAVEGDGGRRQLLVAGDGGDRRQAACGVLHARGARGAGTGDGRGRLFTAVAVAIERFCERGDAGGVGRGGAADGQLWHGRVGAEVRRRGRAA